MVCPIMKAGTAHEAVNEVLKDDRTFVRNPRNARKHQIAGMHWWMPRSLRVLAENMLGNDDPDHRRLRRLVDQAFNRQSVEGLRQRIAGICDNLSGSDEGPWSRGPDGWREFRASDPRRVHECPLQ